ncbi:MAG: M28 family peptidase [Gemmatimonadaceae bacterium]
MKRILSYLALAPLLLAPLVPAPGAGQSAPAAPAAAAKSAIKSSSSLPLAISAIKEADLKRDLYAMASDSMRGREAGTIDELRASMWIANQFGKIGVAPKGLDGTYFQWWNMQRTRVSTVASSVTLDGKPLALWTEISPTANLGGDASAQTVFVGDGRDSTIDVTGKIAVVIMRPPTAALRTTTNSYEYRYARAGINATGTPLVRRGAAGVIVVADSIADIAYDGVWKIQQRGAYDVPGGVPRNAPTAGPPRVPRLSGVPVLFVHRASLGQFRENGHKVDIHLSLERFESPSVNVIGVVRGTDPKLRDEYVLFSSHQDHDGVRYAIDGDSVWSGADDNASTSVALLAIARAFVKQPAKRSALFVFHGAEERGLLGSRYHAAHPVVPLQSIVAVLNGDMIGRNNPDSAALLGSQPPHRNSTELVQAALNANAATGKFIIDSLWDRPTHPEGWYFRSDHVPYARLGVPAIFFSTNLHPDYHTPRDKPAAINYPKLLHMTKWIYMTGWTVANAVKRPAVDAGFKLER